MSDEPKTCPTCNGHGTVTDEVNGFMRIIICPTCKGARTVAGADKDSAAAVARDSLARVAVERVRTGGVGAWTIAQREASAGQLPDLGVGAAPISAWWVRSR